MQDKRITTSSHNTKPAGSPTVDPFALVRKIKGRGPAPVHLWDPPFCGDIDMLIARDGTWFHDGRAIRRLPMVKLFSSILKLENGSDYFLVTPVEKVGIRVEDCPFLITEMDANGFGADQQIEFTTNTEERFFVDKDHPLDFGSDPDSSEPHPTVHVRQGLNGLISRSVFYRLVDLATEGTPDNPDPETGVWAGGHFFTFT